MCNTAMQQQHNTYTNTMSTFSFPPFHLLRAPHRQASPVTDATKYKDTLKKTNSNHGIAQILNEYESSIATTLNSTTSSNASTPSPIQSPLLDVTESTNQFAFAQTATTNYQHYLHSTFKEQQQQQQHQQNNNNKSAGMHENLKNLFNTTAAGTYKSFPATPLPLSLLNSSVLPLSSSTLLNNNNNSKMALPAFEYISPANSIDNLNTLDYTLLEFNRVGIMPPFMQRRPRGEKRPIPDEQKDEKYYERRKRNNEAAKKSRDARKIREDRIAFRAALLEQENSILRAQVMALRDELQTVRQLMSANMARPGTSVTSAATTTKSTFC